MPTLLDYFNNDFKDLSIDVPVNLQNSIVSTNSSADSFEVKLRVRIDSDSLVRLFTFYIPSSADTFNIIMGILTGLNTLSKITEGLDIVVRFRNDVIIGQQVLVYSRRLYLYTETLLSKEELRELDMFCKHQELFVTIRSTDYMKDKMETELPLAFISHDSRDKDLIARRIADGLSTRLATVWFDEFSLKIGDSLRESIEKGIREAKKCILVITPHYLSNPGWGKVEFNSIFTREVIMNQKIVLPIWFNVSTKDVYEYSPSLADKFALTWPQQGNKTNEQYQQEIEVLISKIHTELTAENGKEQ